MTLVIILLGIALYFLWELRQELADISQRQRQLAASMDHLAGRLDAMQSNASRSTTATEPERDPAPEASGTPANEAIGEGGFSGITSVEKAAAAATSAPQEPVNLNTANKSTLQTLPRIGRASADNIIAARPFTAVTQLSEVAGISPALFEELRERVTV